MTGDGPSGEMRSAALMLLATLDDRQRALAARPFSDDAARRWLEYRPRRRPGACIAQLSVPARKAAHRLLATGLSEHAYAQAMSIVALEEVLDRREQWRRGRHSNDYWVSVFGDPAADVPWSWRFEGHHLSVTMTVADGEVSPAPIFFGANPACVSYAGRPVSRPLAPEEDRRAGRALCRRTRPLSPSASDMSAIRVVITARTALNSPASPSRGGYRRTNAGPFSIKIGGMASHVALLRGINVGGRNKVPMAELREVVTSLGHTEVTTYIQSGNVLFSTQETDTARLAASLEEAISSRFGIWASVVVLSREHLARTLRGNPYPDAPNPKFVHVVFMNAEPPRDLVERIRVAESKAAAKGSHDTFTAIGEALFLHTPDGYGTSELAEAVFRIIGPPGKQGIAATARNWVTSTKLLSLCEET